MPQAPLKVRMTAAGTEKVKTFWPTCAMALEHAQRALAPGLEAGALTELKAFTWNEVLDEALARHRKTTEDVTKARANADWKVEIAGRLRNAGAPYAWIAERLQIGSPSTIRVYLHRAKSSI